MNERTWRGSRAQGFTNFTTLTQWSVDYTKGCARRLEQCWCDCLIITLVLLVPSRQRHVVCQCFCWYLFDENWWQVVYLRWILYCSVNEFMGRIPSSPLCCFDNAVPLSSSKAISTCGSVSPESVKGVDIRYVFIVQNNSALSNM